MSKKMLALARDILDRQNKVIETGADDESLGALATAISASEESLFSTASFIYRCLVAAYRLGWERGWKLGRGEQ